MSPSLCTIEKPDILGHAGKVSSLHWNYKPETSRVGQTLTFGTYKYFSREELSLGKKWPALETGITDREYGKSIKLGKNCRKTRKTGNLDEDQHA